MTRQTGPEQLTRREQEIARLIGRGMRNAEMAAALGISKETVKNHVANGMQKLGLRSRTALAMYILESDRMNSMHVRRTSTTAA